MNAVRRALAAVAVSGTALAGVGVAGATAALAANPVPTSLSITAPHRVTYGHSAAVGGKLTNTRTHKALGGQVVRLMERRPGTTTWTMATSGTTASNGSVAFSVTLSRTEEVELVHPAGNGTQATTSTVATIKVAYAVTASLSGHTVSVSVAPAAVRQPVALQQKKGHQWVTLKTTKLNSHSHATFTITPPKAAGTYHYRVVKPSAHGYLLGVSSTLALTVP